MSIEARLDLDLDAVPLDALVGRLGEFEQKQAHLVTLGGSLENIEAIRQAFCTLRACGISPLLLIRKPEFEISREEILAVLGFLRDWDQLLLRNLLEIVGERVPASFLPNLAAESKTEFKWFQEWQTAVSDPRLHRYPGLPWRSFLRKVNNENFEFAQSLLRDDAVESLDATVKAFLISKKKTICIFPKYWRKT